MSAHDGALLLLTRRRPTRPDVPVLPLRPLPEARAPLPPFDEGTWESGDDPTAPPLYHPVYTDLWSPPLTYADGVLNRNVRWWRGDCWGVTVPGLPLVPGTVPESQERVLSWFLDRYARADPKWFDVILNANRARGYTHFSLSPQNCYEMGMSEDDYVAMSVRVHRAGFFVHHLGRSKYYVDPGNLHAGMDTLIPKLLERNACQVWTPAWECNFLSPDQVQEIIDHDHAIIGMRCAILIHFFPHYVSWPNPPPDDSSKFWKRQYGKVDGLLYQCDPNWSAGMMAARINDALVRLAPGGMYGLSDSGRGHPIDVVAWELIATQQFWGYDTGNGRYADEDVGNVMGYELLCAPGPMAVCGFGNGARYPDGSVL